MLRTFWHARPDRRNLPGRCLVPVSASAPYLRMDEQDRPTSHWADAVAGRWRGTRSMVSDDDIRAAPAATIAPPQTPSASGLSTLGVGVVVVAALYLGREVFVPLVLATLLSFVLAPLANLFRRLRIGRVASVAAT